jgi:hypothetical protein
VVEDIIRMVGGEHRYQKFLLFGLMIIAFINGFQQQLTPYIYFQPDFYCNVTPNSKDLQYKCTQAIACENKNGYSVKNVRDSIVTEEQLWCENKQKRSNAFAFIDFAGSILCFIIGMHSDRLGRKVLLFCSFFLILSGVFLGIYVKILNVNTFANMLISLGCDLFTSTAMIYFSEFSVESFREKSNMIFAVVSSVGMIACHFVCYFILNYKLLYLIVLFFCIPTLGLYFSFHETPYYLYSQGNKEEFLETVLKIKKYNKNSIELSDQTSI